MGFAAAAIGFGICAFVWPEPKHWLQLGVLGHLQNGAILVYLTGAIQLLGGVALLWPRTVRAGAIALGALYSVFSLLALPPIAAHPLVYNSWGNFFEQCAFVSGAALLYASSDCASEQSQRIARAAYYLFALCVMSFGLEQLFYLSETASLVPKWIPPGQTFWAIATTVAFFAAAIALLIGWRALLAARLTAVMLLVFALIVWLPAIVAGQGVVANWSEGLETLAIAATAWIVANFLAAR